MGAQSSNSPRPVVPGVLTPSGGQVRPPMLPPQQNPWGNDPWPQAHGQKELSYDTKVFRQVVAKLKADLAEYEKTASRLAAAGRLQASDVGGWAAGQDLFATTQQAHRSILAVHDAFVAAYRDLIDKIDHSAGVYDEAANRTLAEIRKLEGLVRGDGGPSPDGGPVSQY